MLKTAVLAPMPDGEREHGGDGERRAAPEVPQSVAHVAAQQIEMLARRRRQNAANGVPPESQRGHGASLRKDIAPLIVERGGHVVAEIAAEVGGEQAEQAAEESVSSRHMVGQA